MGGPLANVLRKAGVRLAGFTIELPSRYGARLYAWQLHKGTGHKYVKRVPYTAANGKRKYRYYYHAVHGRGIGHDEHFVAGAKFKTDGGHYHISEVHDDGTVTVVHDETGKSQRMGKAELAEHLHGHHGEAIAAHKKRMAIPARFRRLAPKARKRAIEMWKREKAIEAEQAAEAKEKADRGAMSDADALAGYHKNDRESIRRVKERAQELLPGIREQDAIDVVAQHVHGDGITPEFVAQMERENRILKPKAEKPARKRKPKATGKLATVEGKDFTYTERNHVESMLNKQFPHMDRNTLMDVMQGIEKLGIDYTDSDDLQDQNRHPSDVPHDERYAALTTFAQRYLSMKQKWEENGRSVMPGVNHQYVKQFLLTGKLPRRLGIDIELIEPKAHGRSDVTRERVAAAKVREAAREVERKAMRAKREQDDAAEAKRKAADNAKHEAGKVADRQRTEAHIAEAAGAMAPNSSATFQHQDETHAAHGREAWRIHHDHAGHVEAAIKRAGHKSTDVRRLAVSEHAKKNGTHPDESAATVLHPDGRVKAEHKPSAGASGEGWSKDGKTHSKSEHGASVEIAKESMGWAVRSEKHGVVRLRVRSLAEAKRIAQSHLDAHKPREATDAKPTTTPTPEKAPPSADPKAAAPGPGKVESGAKYSFEGLTGKVTEHTVAKVDGDYAHMRGPDGSTRRVAVSRLTGSKKWTAKEGAKLAPSWAKLDDRAVEQGAREHGGARDPKTHAKFKTERANRVSAHAERFGAMSTAQLADAIAHQETGAGGKAPFSALEAEAAKAEGNKRLVAAGHEVTHGLDASALHQVASRQADKPQPPRSPARKRLDAKVKEARKLLDEAAGLGGMGRILVKELRAALPTGASWHANRANDDFEDHAEHVTEAMQELREHMGAKAAPKVAGKTSTGKPMHFKAEGKHPVWGGSHLDVTTEAGHENAAPKTLEHGGKSYVRSSYNTDSKTVTYHEHDPARHVVDKKAGIATTHAHQDHPHALGGIFTLRGQPKHVGGDMPDRINDPHHGTLRIRSFDSETNSTHYHQEKRNKLWHEGRAAGASSATPHAVEVKRLAQRFGNETKQDLYGSGKKSARVHVRVDKDGSIGIAQKKDATTHAVTIRADHSGADLKRIAAKVHAKAMGQHAASDKSRADTTARLRAEARASKPKPGSFEAELARDAAGRGKRSTIDAPPKAPKDATPSRKPQKGRKRKGSYGGNQNEMFAASEVRGGKQGGFDLMDSTGQRKARGPFATLLKSARR